MTRPYKSILGVVIALIAIIFGSWYLVTDRSVAIGLSRMDVREDRVLSIEMYDGGPRQGGHITLPAEMVGKVLASLRQDNSTDDGCGCGTSGLQTIIHMRGEPDIAQVSYTNCGGLVLHDGKGHMYSYFMNEKFIDLAIRYYEKKIWPTAGVIQDAQQAAPSNH